MKPGVTMASDASTAAAAAAIPLPPPAGDCEVSVFAALQARSTTREISARALPDQLLANLLWAACGVNRKPGPFGQPGRTAASASNSQEIELFVALESGVYRYDAAGHCLLPVIADDVRGAALTPHQRGIDAAAPVQLIYVVDLERLTHTAGFQEPGLQDPEVQKSYYYVDTGLIAGNVYLFAAACGLAAWFHNCDRVGLAQRLGLRASQRVLFAQSVGYPGRRSP
ncbi:MAG: nitroreductase family protein [Nevskia sp.]|nr:nitroreductase family protein [Nevskia sp.]